MLNICKRILFLTLVISSVQCHWRKPPPTDTLVVALGSEPKTLDPRFATDAYGQRIGSLIFSSLVRIGDDLNIIGDAAESWTYKNLTYTFKLKPNISFHDGAALTTEDIVFSINEFKKPSSPFSPMMSVIKDVKADYGPSGGSLTLHLTKFSAPFLNDLSAMKLLPKKVLESTGDEFYRNPIGSGVFSFYKRDHKNIYLKSNENYFGQQSKSKFVQFKIIKDANTRFQKMYKGKIDLIQADIPFSKVSIFKNSEKFNVVVAPGLSTTYVLLNLRDPLLKNPEIRRAIHSSIKRDELIKYSFEGLAESATSIVSTANPFHNYALKDEKYSPDKVSQIFSQLKDTKFILKTSNQLSSIENGKVIAHQLRKMGLNVELQSYEWGTYYGDVRTGKFQVAIMKWVGINDPDIYRVSLHSKMVPPGRNRGYYSNPIFDKLVELAFVEPNNLKRKSLYNKAQAIAFKDLPTIPLWYEKQVAIVHKRVKNYSLPTTGNFTSLVNAYKEDDGK